MFRKLGAVEEDKEDTVGDFAGCPARGNSFKSLRSSARGDETNDLWSAKNRSRIGFSFEFLRRGDKDSIVFLSSCLDCLSRSSQLEKNEMDIFRRRIIHT